MTASDRAPELSETPCVNGGIHTWLIWIMLCGLRVILRAAGSDGLTFDPFSFA